MSNLDRPLGDLIKQNRQKKPGGAGGAGKQGGIAKAGGRQGASQKKGKVATRGGRQQPAQGKQQQNGGNGQQRNAKPKQNKPRQQAKATPVAAMRAQGKAQSRSTTANRQAAGRATQLARARGQIPQGAAAPAVGSTVLLTTLPNGQQTMQPVALVQQPGQAGTQVVAIAAPQRTNQPLFKVANIKARQSGGGQQQNRQRQSGGGNRQAANGQGRRRN